MWIALQVLTKFPVLAEAVASRFDELLLDEAQDTSELQLACLELIQKTGRMTSMVLIGDLEQSIYSFQGASAERSAALAETLWSTDRDSEREPPLFAEDLQTLQRTSARAMRPTSRWVSMPSVPSTPRLCCTHPTTPLQQCLSSERG